MHETAIRELIRRAQAGTLVGADRGGWNVEALAFPAQLKAIRDPAANVAIACGRQSGKTDGAALRHLDVARRRPNTFQLFIAPTRGWAKRVLWDRMLRLNDDYRMGAVPEVADLSLRFRNGALIALMGADTQSERAKVRGRSYVEVTIEEAQAWPFWLMDFIREDIRPAQRNVRGRLVIQGTPPASLEHPFYKAIWRSETFSKHCWNITHWPPELYRRIFGRSPEEALAEDLRDRGVGPDDITFRREMLGEFLADETALAYKYSPTKNAYTELPSYTHVVLGVDLGWHDKTVIAVLVWDERRGTAYLAEEVILGEATFGELVASLRPLVAKYSPLACIVDSSGNRQGFETIKAGLYAEGLTGLAVEPRRVLPVGDQVGTMNQALRSGRLMLPPDSTAASDMRVVVWEKNIVGGKLGGLHSDAIPALTYAYCYAQALLPEVRGPAPPPRPVATEAWERDIAAHVSSSKKAVPWWEMAQQGSVEDETDYPIG